MTKFKLQISAIVGLLLGCQVCAQQNYSLHIKGVDKDSSFIVSQTGLATTFPSRLACIEYVFKLPVLLQSKGYVTASIDSIRYDSTFAQLVLFMGERYYWAEL